MPQYRIGQMVRRIASSVILSSDEDGCAVIVDESTCRPALEALGRGEEIYLTVGGRVVSKVTEKDGEFIEEKI